MTIIDDIRNLNVVPYASHITRIENLEGIFAGKGLKARAQLASSSYADISEPSVQQIRAQKVVPQTGRRLHDYVPFFLTFKAPMVAMRQTQNDDLVYIQVVLDVFTRISGCVLTDGNAASAESKFELFDRVDALKILDLSVLYKVKYRGDKELARKKAAELLVPDFVPLAELRTLIFYSEAGRDKGLSIAKKFGIQISVKVMPRYFFETSQPGAK
jgi:ssDNA thymidine ADP-ribosyltransferase, DarT